MTSRSDDMRAQLEALGLTPPFREQDGEVRDAQGVDVALPCFDSWITDKDRPLARLIAEALNRAAGVAPQGAAQREAQEPSDAEAPPREARP